MIFEQFDITEHRPNIADVDITEYRKNISQMDVDETKPKMATMAVNEHRPNIAQFDVTEGVSESVNVIIPTVPVLVLRAATPITVSGYLEKDLGSSFNEVWLTFGLAFDAAAIAIWSAPGNFSGFFGLLQDATPDFTAGVWYGDDSGTASWLEESGGASATPVPVPSTWMLFELHYRNSDALIEFYINSNLVISDTSGTPGPIPTIIVGNALSVVSADSVAFLRDIKVGTTRGGTDILADDFSSGNFSAWTTVVDDCTLVADPFS